MGRTDCTEPQCLYKDALYPYFFPAGTAVVFVPTGRSGVRIAVRGQRSLSQNIQTNSAAHLTYYSVITVAICGGVKLRGERRGEADCSPPSNPEVKNEWSCTPHAFMKLAVASSACYLRHIRPSVRMYPTGRISMKFDTG